MTDIIIFLCKFVLHSLFLHVHFLNIHIIMIYKCCSFLFYMSTRRMEINSAALNLKPNLHFHLRMSSTHCRSSFYFYWLHLYQLSHRLTLLDKYYVRFNEIVYLKAIYKTETNWEIRFNKQITKKEEPKNQIKFCLVFLNSLPLSY